MSKSMKGEPMGAYDCDCINNLEYDRRERKERERLTKSQSTAGQLNDGAQSTNLIDRQQAIDAIAQCTNCGDEDTLREYVLKHSLDNGWTGGVLEALDAVKNLPPAQPDLDEWCTDCREYDKDRHSCPRWNRVIRQTVEDMKAAQPEPHEGHWIRTDCGLDVECKCSVCGYKDFVEPHDTYWFKRNYCPNCGARMTNK
jgi:hypothetical protein